MSRIGELLLARGALLQAGLDESLRFQDQFGGLVGQAFLKLGLVREDVLLGALSEQLMLAVLPRERVPDTDAIRAALSALKLSESFLVDQAALVWFDAGEPDVLNTVARNPISPAPTAWSMAASSA